MGPSFVSYEYTFGSTNEIFELVYKFTKLRQLSKWCTDLKILNQYSSISFFPQNSYEMTHFESQAPVLQLFLRL